MIEGLFSCSFSFCQDFSRRNGGNPTERGEIPRLTSAGPWAPKARLSKCQFHTSHTFTAPQPSICVCAFNLLQARRPKPWQSILLRQKPFSQKLHWEQIQRSGLRKTSTLGEQNPSHWILDSVDARRWTIPSCCWVCRARV
jgi:hypothetical protein